MIFNWICWRAFRPFSSAGLPMQLKSEEKKRRKECPINYVYHLRMTRRIFNEIVSMWSRTVSKGCHTIFVAAVSAATGTNNAVHENKAEADERWLFDSKCKMWVACYGKTVILRRKQIQISNFAPTLGPFYRGLCEIPVAIKSSYCDIFN